MQLQLSYTLTDSLESKAPVRFILTVPGVRVHTALDAIRGFRADHGLRAPSRGPRTSSPAKMRERLKVPGSWRRAPDGLQACPLAKSGWRCFWALRMALRDTIDYSCAAAACCIEAELEVLPCFYGGLIVIRVLACYSCRNTRKGGAYDSDWTGSAGGAHQFAGRAARVGAARDSAGECTHFRHVFRGGERPDRSGRHGCGLEPCQLGTVPHPDRGQNAVAVFYGV